MKFIKKILREYWQWCLDKANDSINVRVIKFGSHYQHGIPYLSIKKRYHRRDNDWVVVEKMLTDALYNFDHNGNRSTPFVVLKKNEPYAVDTCIYALSYEASFAHLSYRTAVLTLIISFIAVVVSLVAIGITVGGVDRYNLNPTPEDPFPLVQ